MKKIILSIFTILSVSAIAFGATEAYYSDTETSTGNTFTAGTLDLNLDGANTNVVKFNKTNLVPGNQPTGTFTLKNVGSVNGFVDLESVSVVSDENGCNDPETEAGDITCGNPGAGEGELAKELNFTLFVDYNGDGWFSTGDKYVFNGLLSDFASVNLNEPLNAGNELKLTGIVNYFANANDNIAQGDSVEFDMTFELGQTAAQ